MSRAPPAPWRNLWPPTTPADRGRSSRRPSIPNPYPPARPAVPTPPSWGWAPRPRTRSRVAASDLLLYLVLGKPGGDDRTLRLRQASPWHLPDRANSTRDFERWQLSRESGCHRLLDRIYVAGRQDLDGQRDILAEDGVRYRAR